MTCEILILKHGKQSVVGKIILSNGVVSVRSDSKHARMFQEILQDAHRIKGKLVTVKSNPRLWFKALPATYSGTYMRARIV